VRSAWTRPQRKGFRRLAATTLVGAALVAAGCGIDADSGPHDVPDEDSVEFDVVASGDEATGTGLVYLLAPSDPDEPARLRAVSRDVPPEPQQLLTSLFSGPNAEEQEQQLGTALPRDLELLSTRTSGRVLTIDVTDVFGELTTVALRLAIAQIVATASELDGVDAVRVRVNGATQVWPTGDGELTDQPLTVYDYPGVVESTQPALPAIPSGEANRTA
jgi:spore germination protein GerM